MGGGEHVRVVFFEGGGKISNLLGGWRRQGETKGTCFIKFAGTPSSKSGRLAAACTCVQGARSFAEGLVEFETYVKARRS